LYSKHILSFEMCVQNSDSLRNFEYDGPFSCLA